MRIGAILGFVAALAVLAGCGQSPSVSPSPPAAVSYSDPAALVAAIRGADGPKLSDAYTNTDATAFMPREAHAQRGSFAVAVPGEEAPWFTVCAVFPDARSRQLGETYGQHLAANYHAQAIFQLKGPNWLVWGIHKKALEAVQRAIGGEIGLTPKVTSSPKASP